MDASFDARWLDRARIGPAARTTLRAILDGFVARRRSGGHRAARQRRRRRRAGRTGSDLSCPKAACMLAYPFAGTPTDFVTVLPGGRERWACCAIDALGIPAFLKQPVTVRSRCHHCGDGFALEVTPEGPVGGDGAHGVDRRAQRPARQGVHVALTHAQLLPVGRPSGGVVAAGPARRRGRDAARGLPPGRHDLRRDAAAPAPVAVVRCVPSMGSAALVLLALLAVAGLRRAARGPAARSRSSSSTPRSSAPPIPSPGCCASSRRAIPG